MAGIVLRTFSRSVFNKNISIGKNQLLTNIYKANILPDRGIRYAYATYERVMKQRRKVAGPDRLRRRSEWSEWNYKTELYAFSKRLHEEISENTLRIAFTHKSYIEMEERKRLELGVPKQDVPLNLVPNTDLVILGENVMSPYIKAFIRHCFKLLPEEGVIAVHDYLLSEEVLSHVSSHIGTTDLILSEDFPVEKSTLATTLKAIVGSIATDGNERQAQMFVQDFVCTQLVAKDILDIWDIPDPLQIVNTLLKKHGRAPCESRLVFESGRNTLESIYEVALYSDKVFLGQAPGETLSIAEEMAAYDVLRRLFKIRSNEKELPFGKKAREIHVNPEPKNSNLSEWHSKSFEDKTCPLV